MTHAPLDQTVRYDGHYPCPVCRHGEIATLTLMEAFACNFCQHIFAANLEQQTMKIADSEITLVWYWNGRRWQRVRPEALSLDWLYGVAAIAFVLLPPSLVALSAYYFPPLPGEPFAWFPLVWSGITFCAHLACILWLGIEYYQFPVGLYSRALCSRWLPR